MSNKPKNSDRFAGLEVQGVGGIFKIQNNAGKQPITVVHCDTDLKTFLVKGTLQLANALSKGIPMIDTTVISHLYDNDSSTNQQLLIEQNGTGDCGLRLLLTGGAVYSIGIDNSVDNDPFKISASNELNTNTIMLLDSFGNNIGLGLNSLNSITSGINNVGYGINTLANILTSNNNVAVGCGSGMNIITGEDNTMLGCGTGNAIVGGSRNICIGRISGPTGAGSNLNASLNDCIIIGNSGASAIADGEIHIGNSIDHSGLFLPHLSVTSDIQISLNSSQSTNNAIIINASNGVGGVDINAGTGGVNITTTGQTTVSGLTLQGGTINSTTTLTEADSNTAYLISQIGSAYIITLPTTSAGLVYEFLLISETGFSVSITANGAHLYGTYSLAGTEIQVNAQTSIIFDTTANIGDNIKLRGIDSTHWFVEGKSSDANGISSS